MSSWVKSDVPSGDVLAGVVGICMLTGILCLIVVLYRISRMDYPREQGEQYYRRTLSVFVVGVCVAFVRVYRYCAEFYGRLSRVAIFIWEGLAR